MKLLLDHAQADAPVCNIAGTEFLARKVSHEYNHAMGMAYKAERIEDV